MSSFDWTLPPAAPLPAAPMPILADPSVAPGTPTIDLIARALSRLPHQYRGTDG